MLKTIVSRVQQIVSKVRSNLHRSAVITEGRSALIQAGQGNTAPAQRILATPAQWQLLPNELLADLVATVDTVAPPYQVSPSVEQAAKEGWLEGMRNYSAKHLKKSTA